MDFDKGSFGDIFDEDGVGRNASSLEDLLGHLTHLITEHEMPTMYALEGLLNILKPGATDMSHDVMNAFRVCMFLQGHGDVMEHIGAVWLTTFPWGLGFHFGFEPDFVTDRMSYEAKHAIMRSLCAILQAGGITAELTSKDLIKITRDNGDEQSIDIDTVVSEFRSEMEKELGPDAPEEPTKPDESGKQVTDWMRRWLPRDKEGGES
jgi:hypothetical protein